MRYGVLLAAGTGSRFGEKKQFRTLAGQPVWQRSYTALREGGIERFIIVVPEEDVALVQELCQSGALLQGAGPKSTENQSPSEHQVWDGAARVVAGGATRSHSVRKALQAIAATHPDSGDIVAIHDAARPFADAEDIAATLVQAQRQGGAILCHACTDTVKRVCDNAVEETIPRETLVLAETPQAFRWDWLEAGYLHAATEQLEEATDDASLMEKFGRRVSVVFGRKPNPKITRPDDWTYASFLATMKWGADAGENRPGV